MRLLLLALSAAAVGTLAFTQAQAASFSCDGASLPAERAVCGNRRLSALDERLAYWYGRAQVRARYFDQTEWLRNAQRAWLANRNACGMSAWCLRAKYHERIRRLKNYVEHV